MIRRPLASLALIAFTLVAALSLASLLPAQTVTLTPTGLIATLSCTTACPPTTQVVYSALGQRMVRTIALPNKADTVTFPRQAQPVDLLVEFTPIKVSKSITLRIPAAATPVPIPVPTPQPQPPPVVGSFAPNLPAGLTLVLDTKVSVGAPGITVNNWEPPPAFQSCTNVTDASAPFGSPVLNVAYPGNSLGDGVGGCAITGPEGQKWKHVHFAMSVFVPANYSTHSNGEKFLYMPNTDANGGAHSATLLQWVLNPDETPNGNTFSLTLLPNYGLTSANPPIVYPNPWPGGAYYWIFEAPGAPRMRKGVWQVVEADLVMNTPGQRDGKYKVWIDGVLVLSGSDALFRAGNVQGYFDGIKFDGTRGGGASNTPTPPGGQARRYNRLAWYASN